MDMHRRHLALPAGAAFVAVAFALVLAFGSSGSSSTEAANETSPTSMALVVTGTLGGNPVVCDTNNVAKCALDLDSSCTVEIVPKAISVGGYGFLPDGHPLRLAGL